MHKNNPIEKIDEDKLEYSYFSYNLARLLHRKEGDNNSYVIGVLGKWGDGKTSAINIALNYLKEIIKDEKLTKLEIDRNLKNEIDVEIKKIGSIRKDFKLFFSILVFIFILAILVILIYNLFLLLKIPYFTNYFSIQIFALIASVIVTWFLVEKFGKQTLAMLNSDINIDFNTWWEKSIKPFYEDKKLIIIKFDPWLYDSQEKILKAFFDSLSQQISIQCSEAVLLDTSKLLIKYLALFAYQTSPLFIDNLIQSPTADIESLKKEISENLKKSGKQFVVVIDDIDRMVEAKEILLLFKIVRILADFPCITYVLAYEKDKVYEILRENGKISKPEEYIKKLVTIEKHLPQINDDELKEIFFNLLAEIIVENEYYKQQELRDIYDEAIKPYLQNLRDIYKFLELFKFIYEHYRDKFININDLILISIIETFDSDLYTYIKENKDIFTSQYNLEPIR